MTMLKGLSIIQVLLKFWKKTTTNSFLESVIFPCNDQGGREVKSVSRVPEELERPSEFTVIPQQWIAITDTSSRRSTWMFCHVVFTILNHVAKHPTPSLDKDSATESKACDSAKFLDPEKETLFCFDL